MTFNMKTYCRDIVSYIEKIAPISLACDWDNPGLLVGNMDNEVKNVVVCLDVTREIVNFAVENDADLILSHHPFIFKGIKKIDTSETKGELIEKIIKNNICVYSAHTNFDYAQNGLNNILAKKIDLHYSNSLFKKENKDCTVGKIGELFNPVKFEDFIKHVKEQLNVPNLRVIGDMNRVIKDVAVFCGAFDESLLSLVCKRADCIVTGDLKHHIALDMRQEGLNVIDAGHFGTEHIFVEHFKKILKEDFQDLNVLVLGDEKDSLIYM